MATLLYCDCGACGAAGACFCCCSAFFSVSSTPPDVGGVTGVAPPGWVCDAGVCVPMIEVGRTAAGHEARPAPHAEATALGLLQQHRADQHGDDHEVNYDNDSLHLDLPSQAGMAGIRLEDLQVFVKSRGVTRSHRDLSPPT